MRITPLDVRKQEFRKAVRGFDCDEVRAFLTTLADEYETVLIDSKQIRERIDEQDEKIAEYKTMERTLRDTLMTAERVMQETRDNATREGDLIIKDAEMKARQVLEECRLRTEELRREIIGLRKEKETYLARFKNLAEAQIQFVDTHMNDFEDLDKRLTEIVDTVVANVGTAKVRVPEIKVPGVPAIAPGEPANDHHHAARPEVVSPPPAAPIDQGSTQEETGSWPMDQEPAATAPATQYGNQEERDIWRDYTPGVSSPGTDDNDRVAELVSETLTESSEAPASSPHSDDPAPQPENASATPEAHSQESRNQQAQNQESQIQPPPTEKVTAQLTGFQAVDQAAVELASRGVPVPAVPAPDGGQEATHPEFHRT